MTPVSLPVSFGEAADKLSILQIKQERVHDRTKRANIDRELALVSSAVNRQMADVPAFRQLLERLKEINGRLWDIEDQLREHERRQTFGAEFVGLARAVYLTNEQRSQAKRAIDDLFDSPIREEKSYGGPQRRDFPVKD